MSSHHFVREGQEPALLIADLVAVAHVESLLEWAPLVVAMSAVVDDIVLRGTKVDVVVAPAAETDRLEETLQDHAPIQIIGALPGRELLTALAYISEQNQRAVTVVSAVPDKIFETLLRFARNLVITVVDGEQKWSLIHGRYRKWLPVDQSLQIIKTDEHQHFTPEGLRGDAPVFTTVAAGIVTLDSPGFYWVGEAL